MTARSTKHVLWTTATLLTASAGAVLVAAIAMPLSSVDTSPATIPTTTPVPPTTELLEPDAAIWSRPLRDLSGKSEQPAIASAPASNQPGLSLAGTVGHTVALLRASDGTIHVRSTGEKLAGAEVMAIEPYKVELRYNGQTITLVKPRPSLMAERIR